MTKKSILAKIQELPENVFSDNITLIPVEKVYKAMDEYAEHVAEQAYNEGYINGLRGRLICYKPFWKQFKAKENENKETNPIT